MKIINKILYLFEWVDNGLRDMYGIDNRNLGKKK